MASWGFFFVGQHMIKTLTKFAVAKTPWVFDDSWKLSNWPHLEPIRPPFCVLKTFLEIFFFCGSTHGTYTMSPESHAASWNWPREATIFFRLFRSILENCRIKLSMSSFLVSLLMIDQFFPFIFANHLLLWSLKVGFFFSNIQGCF